MLPRALAALMIALGIGIIVQTAVHGGSGFAYGFFFGPLLILAGALRLYLSLKVRG